MRDSTSSAAARAGHRYQLLGSVRGAAKRIEPVLVTLTEGSEVFPLFQHDGTEFIYMLRGRMTYGYGSNRYVMRPGDALRVRGRRAPRSGGTDQAPDHVSLRHRHGRGGGASS